MKEILNLLSYKETINLGLALLCKKYNFELCLKKEQNDFIYITLKSLDVDKKIIFKSINKLKCQLRDNVHLFHKEYVSMYINKVNFPNVKIYWYTKD